MHSNGAHFETRYIGSEAERYQGALTKVLAEMDLIRTRRGLEEKAKMPEESKKLPVDDLPSTVKIRSNDTSWTVEVAEDGATESTKYVYGYSLDQVTLHRPEQEAEGFVVPRNGQGADILEKLHEVLFDFHDAGL